MRNPVAKTSYQHIFRDMKLKWPSQVKVLRYDLLCKEYQYSIISAPELTWVQQPYCSGAVMWSTLICSNVLVKSATLYFGALLFSIIKISDYSC